MSDPVSWLLIEPGWRVESSDGSEAGRVLEVTGDSSHDIFDGLVIASSALARPRYLPAEQVDSLVAGIVRLKLDATALAGLAEFSEPPEEEQIEPEKASLLARAETAVAPSDHRGRISPIRRILLWFGLAGRR